MTKGGTLKIAVASGKGGTGKTFVSTNLFHTLEKKGYRVTITDCDAEAPNVMGFFNPEKDWQEEVTHQVPVIDTEKCVFCGKCYEYCEYQAIFYLPEMKIIKVMEDLCQGCGACTYACEYGAITEKAVSLGLVSGYKSAEKTHFIEARTNIGVMSPVSLIKKAISKIDPETEIAIFDAPPGTSCPFIQTAVRADFVLLVTEPTPFGLSDLRQSIETLKQLKKPCGVIVNRAGLGDKEVYSYLSQEAIPLMLEIPFSREIAAGYTSGQIVCKTMPALEDQLYSVFLKITQEYGNSNYQR
ncbi:MAG TPA: ATP-binding protein [Bacteroidales bacterium]|nr:ATP-binding protein [Bacteroidales bacterium]